MKLTMRSISVILLFLVCLPQLGSAQAPSPLGDRPWLHRAQARVTTTPAEIWLQRNNYRWDTGAQDWALDKVYVVERNGQEQIVEEVVLTPGQNGLDSSLKYTYTYPIQGQPWTERLDQFWNGSGWEDNLRQLHSYDAQGNQTIDLEVQWTGGSWDTVGGAQFEYTYNLNNQAIELRNNNWDPMGNGFEPISRERYSYDSSNEPDTVWIDSWNGTTYVQSIRWLDINWNDYSAGQPAGYFVQIFNNGFWANWTRFNWVYGANGSYEQTDLSWINSAWVIMTRRVIDFDAQERLTLNETYNFTNNVYEFVAGSKFNILYNTDDQPLEIVRQTASADSIYLNSEKDEYDQIVSRSPAQLTDDQVKVFPNPFQDRLQLQFQDLKPQNWTFTLMDQTGKLVYSQTLANRTSFSSLELQIPQLPKGIYLYQLIGQEGISRGKLIK